MSKSAFIKFTFGEKTISFNKEWVASKSLKDFTEHEKHHALSPEQYKEVWDACKDKPAAPAAPVETVK